MNDRTDRNFNYLIKGFISLICLHGIATYLQITLPIPLVFGPIYFKLYLLSVNRRTGRSLYFHLIPFVLLFALYCSLSLPNQPILWATSYSTYYALLDLLTMFSIGGYGIYVWLAKRDRNFQPARLQLVLQMGSVNWVLALFFGILFLSDIGVLNNDMIGFDSFLIVWGLLIILICLMVSYLIADADRKTDDENALVKSSQNVNFINDTLTNRNDSTLNTQAAHLEKTVNEQKIFLNSGLSLDDVSSKTGIPKHQLSQIFNVIIGKSFYQYIAEKRIQEAMGRIDEGDNLTLESLAYDCGFNSKTSFNKYFKSITGKTPSEYRSQSEMQGS